ncbi:MAG: hypothetical protein JWR69_4084, partial [Pedosphaera sp.]|nr:hypothetical protein [Pedosphaera sp.]
MTIDGREGKSWVNPDFETPLLWFRFRTMPNQTVTSFLRPPGRRSVWLQFAFALLVAALHSATEAQVPGEELRTAAAVRGLTVEQAQERRSVRLRGV